MVRIPVRDSCIGLDGLDVGRGVGRKRGELRDILQIEREKINSALVVGHVPYRWNSTSRTRPEASSTRILPWACSTRSRHTSVAIDRRSCSVTVTPFAVANSLRASTASSDRFTDIFTAISGIGHLDRSRPQARLTSAGNAIRALLIKVPRLPDVVKEQPDASQPRLRADALAG